LNPQFKARSKSIPPATKIKAPIQSMRRKLVNDCLCLSLGSICWKTLQRLTGFDFVPEQKEDNNHRNDATRQADKNWQEMIQVSWFGSTYLIANIHRKETESR